MAVNAFETAWDILKNWGEGFRVHGFDLAAPAVTEAVPIYGKKWNEEHGRFLDTEINPKIGGYRPTHHEMLPGRGSGTGVSGTYYHGGPFDPMYRGSTEKELLGIQEYLRENDGKSQMVYIPKPKKPLITSPKFRDASMTLLNNVLAEGGKDTWREVQNPYDKLYSGNINREPPIVMRPEWNDPISDDDKAKHYADIFTRYYTADNPRKEGYSPGSYWSNFEDLKDGGHETTIKPYYTQNLYRYLQDSPIVQRHGWGGDDGYDYYGEWMEDPEILQELDWRMKDLGGLSPMNVLLGDMGHDALTPWLPNDRGHSSGMREVTQGSVLMPPTEDGWWENYHPMESGEFEPLTADHVENWIQDVRNVKEIMRERLPVRYERMFGGKDD